jgi:hypothetical protein
MTSGAVASRSPRPQIPYTTNSEGLPGSSRGCRVSGGVAPYRSKGFSAASIATEGISPTLRDLVISSAIIAPTMSLRVPCKLLNAV